MRTRLSCLASVYKSAHHHAFELSPAMSETRRLVGLGGA